MSSQSGPKMTSDDNLLGDRNISLTKILTRLKLFEKDYTSFSIVKTSYLFSANVMNNSRLRLRCMQKHTDRRDVNEYILAS